MSGEDGKMLVVVHSVRECLKVCVDRGADQEVGEGGAGSQGLNDSRGLHGQHGVGNVAGPQLDDTRGDVGLPAGSLLLVPLDDCGQALQHQVQGVLP